MKLFKKFIKFIKSCGLILGTVMVGTYLFHSLTLSYEARKEIVYSEPVAASAVACLTDIKGAINQQQQRNEQAQQRYLANRAEAVKHRANRIELKKEELKRMRAQGYEMTGNVAADALTLVRYNMRKECLKHDWDMTQFASEAEILKMADIYAKKAEGSQLTSEEMTFYAMMKGRAKKLEKVVQAQEKEDLKEEIKDQQKSQNKLLRENSFKHFLRSQSVKDRSRKIEVFSDNVVKSIRGQKVIYAFPSQQAFIESDRYLTKIAERPSSYVIALEDQRLNSLTYRRLDPRLIDKINQAGLCIEDTVFNQANIEIYFAKGEASQNKIQKQIAPLLADELRLDELGGDEEEEALYQAKNSQRVAEEGGILKKWFTEHFKPKDVKRYEEQMKALE